MDRHATAEALLRAGIVLFLAFAMLLLALRTAELNAIPARRRRRALRWVHSAPWFMVAGAALFVSGAALHL
jgi:hypothetical protein